MPIWSLCTDIFCCIPVCCFILNSITVCIITDRILKYINYNKIWYIYLRYEIKTKTKQGNVVKTACPTPTYIKQISFDSAAAF